jgi:hypothetical protein
MHTTRLMGDLLDAARVATGKLHLGRTRLDLREVFENVVDVCMPARCPPAARVRGSAASSRSYCPWPEGRSARPRGRWARLDYHRAPWFHCHERAPP